MDKIKELNIDELPLIARRAYEEITNNINFFSDKSFEVVNEFFETFEIKKMLKKNTSIIFEFQINENLKYKYSEILEAILANIKTKKTVAEAAAHIIEQIVFAAATEINSIADLVDDDFKPRKSAALEKYIDFLESETKIKDVWTDIFNWPFFNGRENLKKHLMFGFTSSSGKSIIIEALQKVYQSFAITKLQRPAFGYDAMHWNASVINNWIVMTDDDNPNVHVDEDYIKNFLNTNIKLDLAAAGGKRWSQSFGGHSYIATNSEEEFFANDFENKRIALLRLDNKMTGFTKDEIMELHNLTIDEILYYVDFYKQENSLINIENKWTIEEKKKELSESINEYLDEVKFIKKTELDELFGKENVEKILGKAKRINANGKTILGYKTKNKESKAKQEKTNTFKINLLKGVKSTEMNEIETTFEKLKIIIESQAAIQKMHQHMFTFADSIYSKDAKKASGIVLDVDKSNYQTLNDVPLRKIGYDLIAYETMSSRENDIRYRVVIPNVEIDQQQLKTLSDAFASVIGEEVDKSSQSLTHRYFVGGKNVKIIRQNENNNNQFDNFDFEELNKNENYNIGALIDKVANAPEGERNNMLFWAINRIVETDDDKKNIEKLINASTLPDDEKNATFRNRFLLNSKNSK